MPDFTTNLLSVMRLYTGGKATCFHPDVGVLIADAKDVTLQCKKPLAIGTIRDGSFQVDVKVSPPPTNKSYAQIVQSSRVSPSDSLTLWIKRLGFPSRDRFLSLIKHSPAYHIPPKALDATITNPRQRKNDFTSSS